ncbi:MAG: heat-inducible transcriptional repressor HrcA [Gammaproteobacteria bacterium]
MGKRSQLEEHMTLNERAQSVLTCLIERYIQEGQPVGSKAIAERSAMAVSSATVRHVMAELEEQGYIHSPHTSAGRVPTTKGYRFFVDTLLTSKPLAHLEDISLQQMLHSRDNLQGLVASTSHLLSGVTQLTGLVTVPALERLTLRYMEFLPLSDKRILAILVFNDHDVENRIIRTEKDYSSQELQHIANYLNTHYAGQELHRVREAILQAMSHDKQNMDDLMSASLKMAQQTLENEKSAPNYVMSGEAHLLELADISGTKRLRQLFDAFSEKQDMLHLLDRCLQVDGVQIFIGHETGYDVFSECSMVTANYAVDDEVLGVLGVIGPTRMNYHRAISAVDVTAKLLSAALAHSTVNKE